MDESGEKPEARIEFSKLATESIYAISKRDPDIGNVHIQDSRSLSENYEVSRAWGLRGELKARGGGDADAHR
jgi:hypothetical protein